MVKGIGNEIIEIKRVKKCIENNSKYLETMFTEKELEKLARKNNSYESHAGILAVKKALKRLFSRSIKNISYQDIEVTNDELGKPIVILKNELNDMYKDINIEVSISHAKKYATAVIILFDKN